MGNYNAKEVCKILQIADSTLRKYALLFEREGYSFLKNTKGQRIYNKDHLVMLNKFLEFKNENNKVENKILIAKLLDGRYQSNSKLTNNNIEFPFPYFNKVEESLKNNIRQQLILQQEMQQLITKLDKKLNNVIQEQEEMKQLLSNILADKEKSIFNKWRNK